MKSMNNFNNSPPPLELKQWQSQAPANTMILGEHSVVYGHPAIACALDQFITIDWQLRSDTKVHIHSALATIQTDLHTLNGHPKLQFVIKALQAFKPHLKHGLNITIQSEFSSTIGLGSSAAVLAAMLDGLNTLTQQSHDTLKLFEIGHSIILDIQGRGSGTDLAASLTGGGIFFEPSSKQSPQTKITKFPLDFPLCLIYAGYKTPTAEVLAWVAKQWQNKSEPLNRLYQQMGETTRNAFQALQKAYSIEGGDFFEFYQTIQTYQTLMEQLGVSDDTLNHLIQQLEQCPTVQAAKISGSGLGDCVLGLGTLPPEQLKPFKDFQVLQVNITPLGAFTKAIETPL